MSASENENKRRLLCSLVFSVLALATLLGRISRGAKAQSAVLTPEPAQVPSFTTPARSGDWIVEGGQPVQAITGTLGQKRPDDTETGEEVIDQAIQLNISKTADSASVAPGERLTYIIEYSNLGTEMAESVRVIESYDSPYIVPVDMNPPPDIYPNYWEISTLLPGATGSITIVAQVADEVGTRTRVYNEVQIRAYNATPASASISTPLDLSACRLAVDLPANNKAGAAGYQVTYDLTLRNTGSCTGEVALSEAISSKGWTIVRYPLQPVSLSPQESLDGFVRLTIPSSATEGTVDRTELTATLTCDPRCENPSAVVYRTLTTKVLSPVRIPLVVKDYFFCFPGPNEQEPNDNYDRANGPLCSSGAYYGSTNDEWDFYSIALSSGGQIRLALDIEALKDVQLQLRTDTGQLVRYVAGQPYVVGPVDVAAGKYYLLVYNNLGRQVPYTLNVSFP